eukprot:SAG25_NODE_664_length_6070_cov_60.968849_3_plen_193_part_00
MAAARRVQVAGVGKTQTEELRKKRDKEQQRTITTEVRLLGEGDEGERGEEAGGQGEQPTATLRILPKLPYTDSIISLHKCMSRTTTARGNILQIDTTGTAGPVRLYSCTTSIVSIWRMFPRAVVLVQHTVRLIWIMYPCAAESPPHDTWRGPSSHGSGDAAAAAAGRHAQRRRRWQRRRGGSCTHTRTHEDT